MRLLGRMVRGTQWRRVACWILVVWVVVFWRLGYLSLLDPDEAHYAELTREMLRSHQWLVPLLDGSPYIDKPVFFHWLQGLSVLLLGETEFALRLPSALGAVALIVTTRWFGRVMFSAAIGESAALMVATVPATFALASIAMFDMVYTAFLFGGVACLAIAALRERPRLEWPGYALLALATVTKGPVALALAGLLFLCAIVGAGGEDLREAAKRLRFARGALLIAALATPWFLWMWTQFGSQFVKAYLLAGNVYYFTEPAQFATRRTDYTFYIGVFFAALFPWSVIAAGRLADRIRLGAREPLSATSRLLWMWIFVVIGFFTAARFRLDHYIFPCAPACCLLSARAWASASTDARWRITRLMTIAVGGVLVGAAAVLSAAMYRIELGLEASALALPVALAGGGTVLLLQIVRSGGLLPRSPAALISTMVGAYAAVVVVGLPVLESTRPTPQLGKWIASNSAPQSLIGMYRLDDWRASLRYYADRRVVTLSSLDEVSAFLREHPDGYVLMRARDRRLLRKTGVRVREAGSLPAIVSRTGKYLRHQVWSRIVIVTIDGQQQPPLAGPTT